MSREEQARKLLDVIGRLGRLMRKENELLSAGGRARGLRELVAEKQALVSVYEQHVKLLSDKESLDGLDPEMEARLREAADGFEALLDENRIRVAGKIEAAKRLFEVIAGVAKEFQLDAGGYGRDGAREAPSHHAYRPAVSVGINQEL